MAPPPCKQWHAALGPEEEQASTSDSFRYSPLRRANPFVPNPNVDERSRNSGEPAVIKFNKTIPEGMHSLTPHFDLRRRCPRKI